MPSLSPTVPRPQAIDWRRLVGLTLVDAWSTGLLLLGLLLRLAVWWPNRGYEPFGDEQYYFRAAVSFSQTGQYSDPPTPAWLPVQRVPLLSLLAGLSFRLFGVDLGPVNLLQIAVSLATCWLIWRWAQRLWGPTAGRWALGLAVIYPTLITHPASFLYTETLYTFLAALALYLLAQLTAGPAGPALSRANLLLAAAAGLATGLTTLTRSSGLTLLAVLLGWLVLIGWRRWRPTLLIALVLLVTTTATIAPWTWRNYRTYGGLLLLDTIGSYNLWRDNALPGENPAAVLVRLPNPIERQRVATERGLANLIEHPDRFLAKLPNGLLYLWHLELDSYARGGGYFEDLTNRTDSFTLTLLADIAFLIVTALALVGLALVAWRTERTLDQRRLQLLLLLWLVANLLAGVVFHSESRFRIAYQPQLIVFAAGSLTMGWALLVRLRRRPVAGLLAGALLLLLLAGAWSPRLLPVLTMQGWLASGDLVGHWDSAAALGAYERAAAALPTSDRPLIVLGDRRWALGDQTGAIAAYSAALERQPHSIKAAVPLAYIYLQAGQAEQARRVLRETATSDTDLLNWAWRAASPPPLASLDLGTGLELGYLANFYPPEEDRQLGVNFRWTNGQGLIRLVVPPAGARRLTLSLNGTRLTAGPPTGRITVVVNGRALATLAADGRWQQMVVDLQPLEPRPGMALTIEVRSDTFVPASGVPGNRDTRRLGVAIDRLALE